MREAPRKPARAVHIPFTRFRELPIVAEYPRRTVVYPLTGMVTIVLGPLLVLDSSRRICSIVKASLLS